MNLRKLFSTFGSKRSATDAPAAEVPAGSGDAAAPLAWQPRSANRDKRAAPARGRRAVPPAATKAPPPAAKRHQAPSAKPAPPTGATSAPALARSSPARPPVQPVGALGETDLSPSRAPTEGLTFPSVQGSGDDVDRAAIRELFSDIAAGQAAPVKTFIGDLRTRTATREWLEICRPVMAVLFESATSLGLDDAARPMNELISAMDLAMEAQEGKDDPIDGAARDVILESYASLESVIPEVFALGGTDSRRETMLLHALLKQVQGVGIVTLDALYGAGLTSLQTLLDVRAGELSNTTGIPEPLCEAICEGLREHRLEVERSSHVPAEQRYGKRLTELLRALVREHDEFERVAEEAGFDEVRAERKRAARRNRNLCSLKIEATLIEMGAEETADKLRILAFDRRIDHLEEFLGVRVAKRAAEQR